jgi:transcriptional regulator with XRE-family HTH domain
MVAEHKLNATSQQDSSDAFAARLRAALKRVDRSAAWLASEVDLSPATVGKYLRGSQPTIIPAVKLAAALGVRLDWLLAGQGEMLGPEDAPASRAAGHHLFEASEQDWVFLPHYSFQSTINSFIPITTETFPVRRDWLKRSLGTERGLWVTEMPTGELPSVAAEGESIVCRNSLGLEPGRAYILGLDGNLIVRRYTTAGFVTEDESQAPLTTEEALLQGAFPVGEILARFGLSPVPTRYYL